MIVELVFGTLGVLGMGSGVAAIMFWKKSGNGKSGYNPWRYTPPLQQQAPAEVEIKWPPELAAVLTHITERLEGSLQKLEVQSAKQMAWPEIAAEVERLKERGFFAATPPQEPEWAKRIENDLAESDKRLARLASDLAANMTDNMARFYTGVSMDLKPPDLQPVLAALNGELSKLSDLPGKISRGVTEALMHERKKNPPPPPEKGKGDNPGPPPRAPRNLPPMNPGELPASPSVPAPYVAGTVDVPAGSVWSLLYLIQKQLSPNCPGSSAEFSLSSDDGPVFVGAASSLGGPLTETNYAYQLATDSPARIYRSTYPGNNTPVGELQVLAPSGASLQVEVQS